MISNGEAEIDDPPLPPLLPRKGSYLTKGRFFWDTLYLGKLVRTLESLIYFLVIPDKRSELLKNKFMVSYKRISQKEKAKVADL